MEPHLEEEAVQHADAADRKEPQEEEVSRVTKILVDHFSARAHLPLGEDIPFLTGEPRSEAEKFVAAHDRESKRKLDESIELAQSLDDDCSIKGDLVALATTPYPVLFATQPVSDEARESLRTHIEAVARYMQDRGFAFLMDIGQRALVGRVMNTYRFPNSSSRQVTLIEPMVYAVLNQHSFVPMTEIGIGGRPSQVVGGEHDVLRRTTYVFDRPIYADYRGERLSSEVLTKNATHEADHDLFSLWEKKLADETTGAAATWEKEASAFCAELLTVPPEDLAASLDESSVFSIVNMAPLAASGQMVAFEKLNDHTKARAFVLDAIGQLCWGKQNAFDASTVRGQKWKEIFDEHGIKIERVHQAIKVVRDGIYQKYFERSPIDVTVRISS